MASPKKAKRTAIVPRAVFAAVVSLASIPSLEACSTHDEAPARRAAELRPITQARGSSPPPPPPTPVATLEPVDLGADEGIDAGADAGTAQAARRTRRHRQLVVPGVAIRPPPYYGVALMTVAVRPPPYGVAAFRQYGVAALDD